MLMGSKQAQSALGPLRPQAASTGLQYSHTHKVEFWRQRRGEARVKQEGSTARMQVRPLLLSRGIPWLLQLGIAPWGGHWC